MKRFTKFLKFRNTSTKKMESDPNILYLQQRIVTKIIKKTLSFALKQLSNKTKEYQVFENDLCAKTDLFVYS